MKEEFLSCKFPEVDAINDVESKRSLRSKPFLYKEIDSDSINVMKRILLALTILIAGILPINPAQASSLCSSMYAPTLADDGLTVSMNGISIVSKPGSYQLTISYTQLNGSADKKIDEGAFTLFFTDGTALPQYGFFGTFFPSDTRSRSYTWEYLKAQIPLVVEYNVGFTSSTYNTAKLNWVIPGQVCNLTPTAAEVNWDGKQRYEKEIDWSLCNSSAQILGITPNCGIEPNVATSDANSATNAANEATDAANAATDAANSAADSADASTQAAQDAGDKADAALAAITSLSQQATSLLAKVAALSALLARILKAIKA